MTAGDRTVLVTGVTGQQGGAVAAHLLAGGWRVRGLTRNPEGAAARAAAATGVEIVGGDLDDPGSLDAAMLGVDAVYSVQPSALSADVAGFGPADEVRQGVNVADAASRARVRHLVYASVAGADEDSGVPIFDSKWRIERHIRALGLPVTVLRPVTFMENYASALTMRDGALLTALEPEVGEQLIAVDDIGGFAALALNDPSRHVGAVLEIAADELTPVQIADAVGRALGRPVPYVRVPLEVVREAAGDIAAQAFAWLNRRGYQVDIAAARALRPEVLTFDRWLERTGVTRLEALGVG